ncbi:MAG: beta-ketoacyl synthase N-terminal-like domain-containing protein, partial [Fimbriiglobus sp.]
MRRRVVVTGLGTVNPIGLSVPDYWQALLAGRSGITPISHFDTTQYKVKFAGEVKYFAPAPVIDAKSARRMDRFTQFAIVAADQAIRDSGLQIDREDPFRCGVILGSGIGGLHELEEQHKVMLTKAPDRVSPFVIPIMIANAAAGNISIKYHLRGPNTTVSTACSSAAHAIGDAMRQIAYGFADVMVTGGSEAAITSLGVAGFIACRALSDRNDDPTRASRPFDKNRDGFVLSEGAG